MPAVGTDGLELGVQSLSGLGDSEAGPLVEFLRAPSGAPPRIDPPELP